MNILKPQMVCAERFFSKFADILGPYLPTLGISKQVLSDPSAQLTLSQYAAILELAAKQRQETHLGLILGQQRSAQDLGVVGYAMIHANTLRDLINTFTRFIHVITDGVTIKLETDGNSAYLRYQLTDPGIIEARQVTEMALACYHSIIKNAIDGDWQLQRVQFQHLKPSDCTTHKALFAAPLVFDADVNALVFDTKQLDQPLTNADPRLYDVLKEKLNDTLQERREDNDLAAKVNHIIAESLQTKIPSLADVAEALNIPPWTLQRRLKDKGLLFSQLINNTRLYMAKTYLKNTDLPMSEIAPLLGYSEVSAFSRAFRRWTASSPMDYRTTA